MRRVVRDGGRLRSDDRRRRLLRRAARSKHDEEAPHSITVALEACDSTRARIVQRVDVLTWDDKAQCARYDVDGIAIARGNFLTIDLGGGDDAALGTHRQLEVSSGHGRLVLDAEL